MPPQIHRDDGAGDQQQDRRRSPQEKGLRFHRRAQEHEIAVAIDDELDDLLVAVAGPQALADEDAQIMGEVGIGFIDRFVLADDAAKSAADLAGARLEDGIGQHLLRLDSGGWP